MLSTQKRQKIGGQKKYRANEHTRSTGVLGKHFKDCVVNTGKDIEMTILHRSNRGLMFLSILEALHIR